MTMINSIVGLRWEAQKNSESILFTAKPITGRMNRGPLGSASSRRRVFQRPSPQRATPRPGALGCAGKLHYGKDTPADPATRRGRLAKA